MAKSARVSETPATAFLKKHRVAYTEHVYEYVEHGGARCGAPRRSASTSARW